MRSTLVAFLLASSVLMTGGGAEAEKTRCTAIRDSAMCTAEPDCWYDAANNKGCLDGPRPAEDRCAVHGSQSICNSSSFGCAWDAASSKCAAKAE